MKKKNYITASLFFLFVCIGTLFVQSPLKAGEDNSVARIKIDIDRTIGEINKNLYGNFVEHLGRCVYGGVYDPDSSQANDKGFRKDVLEKVGYYDVLVNAAVDTHIRLKIINNNFNIAFSPNSVVYTEYPEKYSEFYRQRVRWKTSGLHHRADFYRKKTENPIKKLFNKFRRQFEFIYSSIFLFGLYFTIIVFILSGVYMIFEFSFLWYQLSVHWILFVFGLRLLPFFIILFIGDVIRSTIQLKMYTSGIKRYSFLELIIMAIIFTPIWYHIYTRAYLKYLMAHRPEKIFRTKRIYY